ncbi:MAG: XRE family transcriptional regulator [Chloroflexota bacterium]|nr:XRE family transcriptional regulator [Chloroflexota bacterium]
MAKSFRKLSAAIEADPERRARVDEYKRAIYDALELAKVRGNRKITQKEMAEALDVTQANISRIEHQNDIYLSTLSSYVQALGGKLEVRAVFPDQTICLAPRRPSDPAALPK